MKKTLFLFTAVIFAVSLAAGCAKSETALEDMYFELSRLIDNPTAERAEILSGEITFNVYVTGEMFEQTFSDEGDDNVYKYQPAMIARNYINSFYLEVSGLKEPLKMGEYYKIKGRAGGSVSYTADNKVYHILEIFAEDAEILKEYNIEFETDKIFEVRSGSSFGKFYFKGAHYGKDSEGDLIILYYTFENLGSAEAAPMIERFEISQNKILLESVNSVPDEADPSAYPSGGTAAVQPAGKTVYYYLLLRPDKNTAAGRQITVKFYDDGFYAVYEHTVDVEKNLNEMLF